MFKRLKGLAKERRLDRKLKGPQQGEVDGWVLQKLKDHLGRGQDTRGSTREGAGLCVESKFSKGRGKTKDA